jgi:hypothetical protein
VIPAVAAVMRERDRKKLQRKIMGNFVGQKLCKMFPSHRRQFNLDYVLCLVVQRKLFPCGVPLPPEDTTVTLLLAHLRAHVLPINLYTTDSPS